MFLVLQPDALNSQLSELIKIAMNKIARLKRSLEIAENKDAPDKRSSSEVTPETELNGKKSKQ